ncbi:MAG: glycosyltransferase [Sandaracinaceae bacterium]
MIIVVPCYNEAERLDEDEVRALLADPRVEVLFVDDGSRDHTPQVLEGICSRSERARFEVLDHNGGKAEAVRHGLRRALEGGAEIVGYADADFATPPGELHRLLDELDRHGANVALGSRVARLGARIERKPSRHYVGRVYATAASWVLRLAVYDTQCGAKLFRRTPALERALDRPFRSRWSFDVELLGRLLAGGLQVEEVVEVPLNTWVDVPGSKLSLGGAIKAGVELLALGVRVRRQGPSGFFPDA